MRSAVVHIYGHDETNVSNAIDIATRLSEKIPDAEVCLVVQGPAVASVLASGPIDKPQLRPNLRLLACAHSLSKLDVEDKRLLPGFDTVPAAAVFLAEQQWRGAAYIRI